MSKVIEWLKIKHNSIIMFITALVGLGQVFDLYELSQTQNGAIMAVVAGFFVLIGAQTVTSNERLTDKLFQGWDGAAPTAIAASDETPLELPDVA